MERAERILAVVVEVPPVSSAVKRRAEPIPAKPPLAVERCSKVRRLVTEEEAAFEAEIVRSSEGEAVPTPTFPP